LLGNILAPEMLWVSFQMSKRLFSAAKVPLLDEDQLARQYDVVPVEAH
jgi:hypothetical protein